jgi:hypothetical protein
MARDYKHEIRDALRVEPFFQGGFSRLVKVSPDRGEIPKTVSGYVTQERFILGLKPKEMEQALGLPVESLVPGCRVFKLARQPGPSQVVYELTTKHPDGLAFTTMSNPKYPPSDKGYIHQWRLTMAIPAILLCRLAIDTPYVSLP